MITEVIVSILKPDLSGFQHICTLPAQPGIDIERDGHKLAAAALEMRFPGLWCYAYATLKQPERDGDPGVSFYTSEYDGQRHFEGVTDIGLIADGGFNGQFHWNERAWTERRLRVGGYVPAAVDTVDPEREARIEAAREQARIEAAAKAKAMNERVAQLPPFKVANGKEQEYAEWMAKQREDGYSGAAVNYGERWAILMQVEHQQAYDRYVDEAGETAEAYSERSPEGSAAFWHGVEIAVTEACAERTSHEADIEGITGNMHGWAVNMLAQFWVHGEALRLWHNQQYGYEGGGVVNPAVLTIGA